MSKIGRGNELIKCAKIAMAEEIDHGNETILSKVGPGSELRKLGLC